MADREIRLVGSFRDDITPKLRKLNLSIDQVTKSFSKMQAKLRPITRDMGTLAMASERVANAKKAQRSAMESSIRTMQQYRREAGALNRANRSITTGLNTQRNSVASSVRAMNQYRTAVGKVIASQKRLKPTVLPPATALPRQPRGYLPQHIAPGGGGAGGGLEAGVFGVTLGNTLSSFMTNAILRGFRLGVGLMQKPFQYFGRAMAERINDEMSDIQSAGGMFALDQKNAEGQRLFKGFADARSMQERLNRSLAQSAAALPGATNDYVRAARGLTDTVMMAFGKNQQAFKGFAEQLGAREGATSEEAITKVLQRFTEQTVLLGRGSRGGMPLTMLMEQLVTRERVNVQAMRMRYVQLRDNPLLASMLEEAQGEINASVAGSAERFAAVMKALDRALPQEVINAMRMSASGLQESIRSAFMDPDTGLFGLGRELDVAVAKTNDFGQFVDAQGNVVSDASKAVKENTTLFKILRDTLGGFLTPLAELASFLPALFDPLKEVAASFVELREVSMTFLTNFTKYTNFFKDAKFEDAGARGALAAINKLLNSLGMIDRGEALANAKFLEKEGSNLSGIAQRLLKQLFSSDLMRQIGGALGRAIGSVLSSITAVLGGANDMANAGPFAKGFKDGFTAAGGQKAIVTIFKSIFGLIGRGILEIFKAAPLETSIAAGLALFGPSIAASVGTSIVSAIPNLMSRALGGAPVKGPKLPVGPGRIKGRPQVLARQAAQKAPGAGRMAYAAQEFRAGKALGGVRGGVGAAVRSLTEPFKVGGKVATTFVGKMGNVVKGLGKFGGALLIFGGLFDFISALFTGKDLGQSLGAAAGPILGTLIGGALLGPLGAFIGGWIGSMEAVTTPLGDAFSAVIGTLSTVTDFLGTILGDAIGLLSGLISLIPGVSDGFNVLHFAIFALLSPFKLLQIGVLGIYEAYLKLRSMLPGGGEAKKKLAEVSAQRQKATDEFTIQGRVVARYKLDEQLAAEQEKLKKARNDKEKKRIREYIKVLEGMGAKTSAVAKSVGVTPKTPAAETAKPEAPSGPSWGEQYSKWWNTNFEAFKSGLKSAWDGFTNFFAQTTPAAWNRAIEFSKNALKSVWDGLVKFFVQDIPYAIGFAIGFKIRSIKNVWDGLVQFFTVTLPGAWNTAISRFQSVLSATWNTVVAFFQSLPGLMVAAWNALVAWAQSLPQTIGATFTSFINYVSTIPGQIMDGLMKVGTAIIDWVKTLPGRALSALTGGMAAGAETAIPKYDGKGRPMSLGSAISTEMRNKPPGSSLVIANSSETVIPAFRGHNLEKFKAEAFPAFQGYDLESLRAIPAQGGYMRTTPMPAMTVSGGGGGGGSFDVGKVEVTINDNTGDISKVSDQAAEMILQSMYRQARAEVITS